MIIRKYFTVVFLILISFAANAGDLKSCLEKYNANFLYKYSVELFGAAQACDEEKTEGTSSSKVTLKFNRGGELTFESFPPETSVAELSHSSGIKNESGALRVLKAGTKEIGLKIDWSKPVKTTSKGIVTKTFWCPEEGINGRAFLKFKKGRLIQIGYGMAL